MGNIILTCVKRLYVVNRLFLKQRPVLENTGESPGHLISAEIKHFYFMGYLMNCSGRLPGCCRNVQRALGSPVLEQLAGKLQDVSTGVFS